MASSPSISTISIESIQDAARAQKVPRGLTRSLMPVTNAASVTADSFNGTAFLAGGMLVIIDPGHNGQKDKQAFSSVIESAKVKLASLVVNDVEATVEGDENAGDEKDDDDADAVVGEDGEQSGSIAKTGKPLDLVVWTRTPIEGDGTMSVMLDDAEIYVQIADSATSAEMVCELATAMFKAVRMPFEVSGGRHKWKEAQRPRITREYAEGGGGGEFKLSFEKRFDTIFNNAYGRIQTTFDNVFDAKVTSAARGVAGRYARKNKLDITWKKPKSTDKAAEASASGP